MDLTDRVAIVTGASSGVGRATARALADEGCRVVLAARREERLERIADDIGGDRALVAPTDVTNEEQVAATVDATHEAFGGVDVLVNNAGVLLSGAIGEADTADVRREIAVNLLGPMFATRAALPSLLEADLGHVVTVSSMNAKYPPAGGSAYAASKAGVDNFCESLRRGMDDEDVRVTVVDPGPIQSEMKDWSDRNAKVLDPEDVADAVRFAVSRPRHVEIPEITVNSTDKL